MRIGMIPRPGGAGAEDERDDHCAGRSGTCRAGTSDRSRPGTQGQCRDCEMPGGRPADRASLAAPLGITHPGDPRRRIGEAPTSRLAVSGTILKAAAECRIRELFPGEPLDVPPLPGGLNRTAAEPITDELDGGRGRNAIQNGNTRQGRPGAPDASAARHVDPGG